MLRKSIGGRRRRETETEREREAEDGRERHVPRSPSVQQCMRDLGVLWTADR